MRFISPKKLLLMILLISPCVYAQDSNSVIDSQIKEQAGTVLIDANTILPFVQVDSATVSSMTVNGLTVNHSTFTSVVINGYSNFKRFVQITSSCTASLTSTTSGTPQNTTLQKTITPTSASNNIIIWVSGTVGYTGVVVGNVYLFRGSTDLGNGSFGFCEVQGNGIRVSCPIVKIDSPATTSATTYIVKVAIQVSGTVDWNPDSTTSCMILAEVTP